MTDVPLISAVVAVYNGERYLAEAIESILQQGRDDCEIIVVDDGSTDGSAEVARRFGSPVRLVPGVHAGVGAARTKGVDAAGGRYLAFLDADDAWLPRKLELQLQVFDADPAIDAVFGHVRQGFSPDVTPEFIATKRITHTIAPCNLPGTMLVTREAMARVGTFTSRRKLGDGIDWYLRALDLGLNMVTLPDVLLWRRIHEANIGILQRDARNDYVQMVKATLDRRRVLAASQRAEVGNSDEAPSQ